MSIKLYDFQAKAIEGLRANIRAGVKNQVLCAPTGAGKTVCAAYLLQEAHAKGKRAVFVADRISLIDQTSAAFDGLGIPHGVIQANHWRWRPWSRIQIASAQTVARRAWPDPLDLIVVDECHASYRSTLARIDRRDAVTIGLTATPFARGMGKHYDAVVTAQTTTALIEDGFLSPYDIYAASEPDMTGAKVSAGEWTDSERESRSMPIVGDCVVEYLKHAAGKKFICFGSTVAHCEELQRQFLAAGVQTGLYTYLGRGDERAEMVDEFRKPDSYLSGLISVAALAKGFDVPSVECVIVARPLRSSMTEHIQMIGRGLRRDPENPAKRCTVLDHAGNTIRFWDQMMEFFEVGATELDNGKRKKKVKAERKKPAPRKCPKCHHVHAPRPHCPMCGYEYTRREIEHEVGELVAVGSGAPTMDEKRAFYGELLTLAEVRGYKTGWAKHKYREKFGVWPAVGDVSPRPVSRDTHNWVRSRQIAYAKSRKGVRRASV